MSVAHLTYHNLRRFLPRLAIFAAFAGLAACQDSGSLSNARAYQPIPSDVLALMQTKDTDAHKPLLIRAYKKESELELWKQNSEGEYVLLKSYPMCRWSGQLGPKTREGDRQVPEGFYTITPGQMNPNSAYYLSFNVGYPNAYDKAHDYTGGSIMVHGICSSAGCFSMTDGQIAEIYAIVRESFGGGQRAIQMQSLPFRMNAENLAKHRFDPNMRFWKELKQGSDRFEITKREPHVAVCGRDYVFSAGRDVGCAAATEDSAIKAEVAEKQRHDDAKVAELVSSGVKAVKIVYADGGQHPDFAGKVADYSRPEAIATGPTEIAINDKGRPIPAVVQVASAAPLRAVTAVKPATPDEKPVAEKVTAAAAPATQPVTAASAIDLGFYTKWFAGADKTEPKPASVAAPVTPTPLAVNPPAAADAKHAGKKQAQATRPTKPQAALGAVTAVAGASPSKIPDGFRAYAANAR